MSNVAIDLTKTVKEIIETMKKAIDNLNTNVDSLKSEVLLAAHPVGSYYISDNSTSPASLFGGTWQMLDPGLTLISQGKGTDKFGSFEFVAGQTYGERMHQLTVDELAAHRHDSILDDTLATDDETRSLADAWYQATLWTNHYRRINNNVMEAGGDKPHNNVQPSRAAYAWFRVG